MSEPHDPSICVCAQCYRPPPLDLLDDITDSSPSSPSSSPPPPLSQRPPPYMMIPSQRGTTVYDHYMQNIVPHTQPLRPPPIPPIPSLSDDSPVDPPPVDPSMRRTPLREALPRGVMNENRDSTWDLFYRQNRWSTIRAVPRFPRAAIPTLQQQPVRQMSLSWEITTPFQTVLPPLSPPQTPISYTRTCPVCKSTGVGHRAVYTGCGHCSCYDCARTITIRNEREEKINTCPVCRKTTNIIRLFED